MWTHQRSASQKNIAEFAKASASADGSGILKRLYIDRIVALKNLADKNLTCKKCETVLGIRTVYQKEVRPAYRLFVGAVEKKVVKGDKLPKINF